MRTILSHVVSAVLRSYPGRLLQALVNSQAPNYASGLAFTAFLSMFPLILGLLSILGLVTSDPHIRSQFLHGALTYFPADAQQSLSGALDGVRHNSGLFGAIGIVGLVWSGSSLFTSMEYSLGRMLGARQRGFLRQRAMTLVMTLVFVVSVVLTIAINGSLTLVNSVPHLQPVVGLLVWLAFMTAVYRIVPNHTHRIRAMWPGILIAAVLTEALSLIWPLYTGLTHGFDTYGAALALFFLLASWLYFLSIFILLGAVAIRMHAGRPDVGGLIATPEPAPLETDATQAADQYARPAA